MKFSRKNPYSVQISLDQLDYPGEELLRKIGEKLLGVFEKAYGIGLNHELQAQNIAQLADTCASLLSTSHRRHFVKSLIDLLAEQRAEGEHLYEQDNVQNVVRAVTAQLGQAQGGEY